MANAEHREYVITGDLPPERWNVLMTLLGHLGMQGGELKDGVIKNRLLDPEALPGPRVNRSDMRQYAEENGFQPRLAGQVWNKLVRNQYYGEFRQFGFDLMYDFVPQVEYISDAEQQYSGLHFASLQRVMATFDELNATYRNETITRQVLFGRIAGPGFMKFLQAFVADFESSHPEREG